MTLAQAIPFVALFLAWTGLWFMIGYGAGHAKAMAFMKALNARASRLRMEVE